MTCARHQAPSTAGAAQITPTGKEMREKMSNSLQNEECEKRKRGASYLQQVMVMGECRAVNSTGTSAGPDCAGRGT